MLPNRPVAYVVASTNHGTMIVNRNDQHMINDQTGYGVGYQLLNSSTFDPSEVNFALALLNARRKHFGDGVVAIDGGANIGVHTIEWARHMHGWGSVISVEAQDFVYYALAGNVAINNCGNAKPILSALGAECGMLHIPKPNYFAQSSFGSLELKQRPNTEFIGQSVSYTADTGSEVCIVTVDSLNLDRLDMFKLDVEGMEAEVLLGATETLSKCKPVMVIEIIKSDKVAIETMLDEIGYKTFSIGINILAVHNTDPTLASISVNNGVLTLAA